MRKVAALLACCCAIPAQDSEQRPAVKLRLADAIRSTLSVHPLLDIQKEQVQISRATKMQASSIFDLNLSASLQQFRVVTPLTAADQLTASQSGITTDRQAQNLSQIQAGADKLFRSGVSVTPQFAMVRNIDNLIFLPGANTGTAGITVSLPLLRGRGYAATGAKEIASSIEIEASNFDLSFTASQLIATVATSYWNYLAALKLLEIATGSQERGRSFVENVQAFIDADRSPRSDLDEVKANLADRTATRLDAEQKMIAARTQLAYDMGLTAADIDLLGEPATDFPKVTKALPAGIAAIDYYTSEAFHRRADLLAANRHVRSADALTVGAKNAIKPQINLTFGVGYSGLHEGSGFGNLWESPFVGVRGVNASGGLTYSFAPANDLARGLLMQANSQERQAEKRVADLQRQIRTALVTAAQAVRHEGSRVEVARQAVESFQTALGGQRQKYRLGLGSVVDILTMEDRLTNALTAEVQAELSYALAVTDFRFGSGTILDPDHLSQTIEEDVMLTLPFDAASIPTQSPARPPAAKSRSQLR